MKKHHVKGASCSHKSYFHAHVFELWCSLETGDAWTSCMMRLCSLLWALPCSSSSSRDDHDFECKSRLHISIHLYHKTQASSLSTLIQEPQHQQHSSCLRCASSAPEARSPLTANISPIPSPRLPTPSLHFHHTPPVTAPPWSSTQATSP